MQRLHDFVYGVLDHVWTAIGELAGFILVLIGCACCFYVFAEPIVKAPSVEAIHAAAEKGDVGSGKGAGWVWSTSLRVKDEEEAVGYVVEFTASIAAESEQMGHQGPEQRAEESAGEAEGPMGWLNGHFFCFLFIVSFVIGSLIAAR